MISNQNPKTANKSLEVGLFTRWVAPLALNHCTARWRRHQAHPPQGARDRRRRASSAQRTRDRPRAAQLWHHRLQTWSLSPRPVSDRPFTENWPCSAYRYLSIKSCALDTETWLSRAFLLLLLLCWLSPEETMSIDSHTRLVLNWTAGFPLSLH
jgi:hypothetical protein